MATYFFTHPVCHNHDPGPGHPESQQRLDAVLRGLAGDDFSSLVRIKASVASAAQIERVHVPGFTGAVLGHVPDSGFGTIDADTRLSPQSGEAALLAAGALCAAVDHVLDKDNTRAFCGVRPPGHHAEPDRAMGFCLFNNVAIGAAHARAQHGLKRVAIIDFDVHHGNGTQACFESDPSVLVAGSHQMPLYPGSGARSETGVGNIVNMPLNPGTDGIGFRRAWQADGLPALRAFEPELIFISAGFDGHRDDPLANLMLVENDYAWITEEICAIADEQCQGRVVSTLEGGYDLSALSRSVAAHVAALIK